IKRKNFWDVNKNRYPDSRMQAETAGAYSTRWGSPLRVQKINGVMALQVPVAGLVNAAAGYNDTPIDITGFTSGFFSAAVDIMQKTGDQGVNSTGMNNLRVRIQAKDASGALMLDAWAGVSGNDDPNSAAGGSARQYFTRNVTRADITSRTRMVIGEGIPIPAGAVALVFNIRAESTSAVACPQMYPTNWLLRDGKDASWTDNEVQVSTGTGLKTVYISPAGSDSADGTAASPLKTMNAAVVKLNGTGAIALVPGIYPGESIPQNLVGDLRIVGLTDSGFNYPVIRFGNPLSGVTKLAGYSRIYSAPLTGYAAGTHPAWMWLDGVPDEDTRETKVSRMSEYMRGMAHRLECTKIWLTTATDKAAALAEMDASNSPLCRWVESEGRVYFTLPNGGDATAAGTAIYAPTGWAALFSGNAGPFTAAGRVSITGIKVRYATINTVGFRESVLTDVHSLGCPQNGMDIGCWSKMYSCRFQGVGSSNIAGTFDGANAHNFSVLEHYNCLFTDNVDDGISCHENCYEIGWAPVSIANLGGGLTPAYGCQAVYYFPYTSRNALQIRKVNGKRGGIESHMSPLTSDPGVSTSVTVYYGISDGDYNGYWSGDTADASVRATLNAIGCIAIDPVNYGFAVTHMMDCRHTGSGTPRKPGTNAPINTNIVT
ncbi:hypothetical protein, partial [Pantoea coffeiphila]|uniref:hypothetical protein n=1 Tax=Pantoea coffeiphila TaxID=1465635 RepID=UPI0019617676